MWERSKQEVRVGGSVGGCSCSDPRSQTSSSFLNVDVHWLHFTHLINLSETFMKRRVTSNTIPLSFPRRDRPPVSVLLQWFYSSYVSTYYRSCLSFLAKLSYLECSVYSFSSRLSPSATFFKSDDVSIKETEVDDFTTWMFLYLDGINPCSY